jgi:GNAT superfamily N-acetyltransferase
MKYTIEIFKGKQDKEKFNDFFSNKHHYLPTHFKYFSWGDYKFYKDYPHWLICVMEGDVIVGIVSFMDFRDNKYPRISICYVSVNKNHKGKGISKICMNEFFKLCDEEKAPLVQLNGYSTTGYFFLKDHISNLIEEYSHMNIENEFKIGYPEVNDETGKMYMEDDREEFLEYLKNIH